MYCLSASAIHPPPIEDGRISHIRLNANINMNDNNHNISEFLVILADYYIIKSIDQAAVKRYFEWLSQKSGNDSINCFNEKISDDIIRWKIVRAFGSLSRKGVIDILMNVEQNETQVRIKKEAERSLRAVNPR